MKVAITIILILHSVIHLIGVFHGFGFIKEEFIQSPISKGMAIWWSIATFLLLLTSILYVIDYEKWWIVGFIAALLSQVLIVIYWSDTRFGSIPNLLLLLITIVAFANQSFEKMAESERKSLIQNASLINSDNLTPLKDLPEIVRNWMEYSGASHQDALQSVYIEQELKMKLSPEDKEWIDATANQYYSINPPSFHWVVDLKKTPLIPIKGRDLFARGKGEMIIKPFSLFSVVDVGEHVKVNQAALHRYLAEISWFPIAARMPYINWIESTEYSATAVMSSEETRGQGTFYFSEDGRFFRFETLRYRDIKDDQPIPWVVEALEWSTFEGVLIPTKLSVKWKMEEMDWTWLIVSVTEVVYNNE